MNTIDDIFTSDIGFIPGRKMEVEGFLFVSSALCYLTESLEKQDKAVLVIAPNIYEQFAKQLAIRAGTMIRFLGKAHIQGEIFKSGLTPLPYAISNIDVLEFEEHRGKKVLYDPPPREYDYFDFTEKKA